MSVVFVLSTGRCGTLSLSKLFALAPGIASHHEPKPQPPLPHRIIAWRTPLLAPSPIDEGRAARIKQARDAGKLYTETAWSLTAFAYVMERDIEGSRFIFLHRNPRTWMLSWMRDGVFVHPKHPAQVQDIIPDPEIAASPEPVRCAWWWNHVNTFSNKFYESSDRCFRISSEELWRPDLKRIAQMFDFIGIPSPDADEIKHWANRKWNTRNRPLPKWEHAWESLLPRELMKVLGYE